MTNVVHVARWLQAVPTSGSAWSSFAHRAQYAIADYLQFGPKRLQIQAFRGVGKSWITGAFVLWTLFNDPEKKIMIISASKERADNMSIFLQKLIIEHHGFLICVLSPMTPVGPVSFDVNRSLTKLLQLSLWALLVNLLVVALISWFWTTLRSGQQSQWDYEGEVTTIMYKLSQSSHQKKTTDYVPWYSTDNLYCLS